MNFIQNGPTDAEATLILAHGAGAKMDSEFMNTVAKGIAAAGVRVLRFEFPYMRKRRETGKAGAPDREPVLLQAWREAVWECPAKHPFIGGKSMGGRMASMVADDVGAAGLVCLGYPFHPPGDRERTRTAHLTHLATRTLIVQGSRDAFGTREDVAGYNLSPSIQIHWIEGGTHDLMTPGTTRIESRAVVVDVVAQFIGA